MKTVERLLPKAIDAVKNHVLNDNKVPKEFNGYISSFGASVIMSGLLPTLVFFSQEGKARGDRGAVIEALEKILQESSPDLLTVNKSLIQTVKVIVDKSDIVSMDRLVNKIQEAAIALKLAIRIFPKSQNESK